MRQHNIIRPFKINNFITSPCGVTNQSNSVWVLFWKRKHQDEDVGSLTCIEKEMWIFNNVDVMNMFMVILIMVNMMKMMKFLVKMMLMILVMTLKKMMTMVLMMMMTGKVDK